MNSSKVVSKVGITDKDLDFLSKLLFSVLFILAFIMLACNGFYQNWLMIFIKYVVLFSPIIPISLRTNLDITKAMSSFYWIAGD